MVFLSLEYTVILFHKIWKISGRVFKTAEQTSEESLINNVCDILLKSQKCTLCDSEIEIPYKFKSFLNYLLNLTKTKNFKNTHYPIETNK